MAQTIHNNARIIVDAGTQTWANLASQYAFACKALNVPYENLLKTKAHHAHILLGALGTLASSVYKNSQLHNVDANDVFRGLIQENERGFNHTFSVTAQDKSNGRLAILELAEYLNGRSTTSKVTNKYTPVTGGRNLQNIIEELQEDPALLDKTRGAIYLLAQSFNRETKEAYRNLATEELNKERANLLITITTNSVVHNQVLFEELAVEKEAYFTNNNTKLYANIVALALITASMQSYNNALNNTENTNAFEVPVSQANLAKALADVISLYRANTTTYSLEDITEHINEHLAKAPYNDTMTLNYELASKGLETLNAHVDPENYTNEHAEQLLALATVMFTYDPENKTSVFEHSKNPLGDIVTRVGRTVLAHPLPELDHPLKTK